MELPGAVSCGRLPELAWVSPRNRRRDLCLRRARRKRERGRGYGNMGPRRCAACIDAECEGVSGWNKSAPALAGVTDEAAGST